MTRQRLLAMTTIALAASASLALGPPAGAVAVQDSAAISSATNGIALGADGNYWVAQEFDLSIQRVTPSGAAVGDPIPVGSNPVDVIAGPNGTIWASVPNLDKVVRIDTAAVAPTATDFTVTTGPNCGPLALADGGNGQIYFSTPDTGGCSNGGGLGSIDAVTGVAGTIEPNRGQIFDMVVSAGKIFATDFSGDVVRRIGLGAGLPVETSVGVPTGAGPDGITAISGEVWVTLYNSNTLAHFPTSQNSGSAVVVTPTSALSSPFGIAPTQHGTVYVASSGNHTILDVAADGTAVAIPLDAGASPWALAVTPDGVLATDRSRSVLSKVADDAPTLTTPTVTATSAATISVAVPVDSHGNATSVTVEYITAGAYRGSGARVPGPATTTSIGTAPASAAGPSTRRGKVSGLEPGADYLVRVKVSNSRGVAISSDVPVTMPKAPAISFKAKVGTKTTTVTSLLAKGLLGGESAKVECKTKASGCPFKAKNLTKLTKGKASLSSLLKNAALEPGTKVTVSIRDGKIVLSRITLTIRDGQQPKVKRG